MKRALPAAAFCFGYFAGDFLDCTLSIPVLWYLPVERRFAFAVRPPGLGADLYGRVLFALACGCAAAMLAAVGARLGASARRPPPGRPRPPRLGTLLVWSVSLLALDTSLHVWTLARRTPLPATAPEAGAVDAARGGE